ncbi:hypothetical protein PC118_g1959 [Phytophthora cactorum]|uniref:Uncharacterized protein n=1 Tax=Phytophthora cactorum TaxID=29920 RepID=A0A8T1GIF4_9STRA|nr:hypothetical protein PC118_g1959 [Phytophthora cactorum]
MPRSTRADGHDAETIASAVVVSTKLRAETSKIVGCVAKYFEEVEAGSSMTRRRNKRAKRHDRATDNVESISAAADAEAQGGGKEVPGNGAMTYKLGEIQPRIYNDPYAEESPVGGWSRCEEIPGGVGVLVPKGSSPQGMKDDAIACKDCTADEKDEVSEHHSEQYCHLTTLILPEIPLITSPIGYVSVKQRGEGRLRELVETLQANSDKTPNWNTPVLGLWSFMETQRDGCKERYISDYNQEMKTHEPLCLLSGPRRLQCGWCETLKSSENFLYDESSMLLKKMVRANAQMLLLKKEIVVPNVFEADRGRSVLEALEATIFQQFQKVKKMCLNPSTFSSVEIVKACTSLRQAAWLHTLRVVSIGQARNGDLLSALSARILPSTKYKLVLGSSNWKDLLAFLQASSGSVVRSGSTEANAATFEEDSTLQPPPKRQRVLQTEKESIPVRVLCSVKFLEQDELLDELCTEQQIFFIERDLPPPIDILVDERNCICVVNEVTFQVETTTRNFIFSLAQLQVQLKKCWLVIALSTSPSVETEDMLNGFLAALVQFRIEIQVLTSFSCEQTGRLVRTVVDECAEVALNNHRVLPRVWFERPFLLEEVSQFERFLVSTKIVNHYAAQSLLHKICVDDLFSKSCFGGLCSKIMD